MKVFNHRGSRGDIIYALPSIIASGGGELNINRKDYTSFLESLLRLQLCISKLNFGIWKKNGINLDLFRHIAIVAYKVDKVAKHLAQSHLEVVHESFDLSKEWLFNIKPKKEAKIIINRTTHYHDKEEIDWKLLSDYKKDILFIGLDYEYREFERKYFDVKRRICSNALEIAELIKGSNLFVGNQSLCFALAEAMKCPRVLEVYYIRNNCLPNGKDGYIYLDEELIKRYLNVG